MVEQHLGPLISDDAVASAHRRRKSKNLYKTVSGATENLIEEKVKLEIEDGWHVERKNAKSRRLAKEKPLDEQLEDEIWCILAQMGFKEMSKGRQFTVTIKDGLNPRQIDVFAKDDETVVIVECTHREQQGKKNMDALIDKMCTFRQPVLDSIRKHFGHDSKLKVCFAIATRNISWSEADLNKCIEAKINVITDEEIEYYMNLVKYLKHAARYQFLAHMFGGQKISGLARQVVATRGKMGGNTFYTFLIRPDELLKIAYVGHKASRNIDNLDTYQRMLQPQRLKRIAEYINDGGKFPTNIVVNFKPGRGQSKTNLKFEAHKKGENETLGMLSLPTQYGSAWVIDGQHRLYAYAYARSMDGFNQDSSMLPVLAYENLSADEEMDLFIDINSKQVKVSTSLLVELYADLHWKSGDVEEAFQALVSRIASRLNSDKSSPLYGRMVVTGKKKTPYRCLTQTSIRDGLRVAKLIGTFRKSASVIDPGPLSMGHADDNVNLKKGITVLSECLQLFSEGDLASHWELGDAPGGYLCTNNGIRALFHVIQDISEHVRKFEHTELYVHEAKETFEIIKPYLQELASFFLSATPQEFKFFRTIGSSLIAVRHQAYEMEKKIQLKYHDFKPSGLQEYLDSRDEEGTRISRDYIIEIQKMIFDFVIDTLKEEYGTEQKAWWVYGVPLKIRTECSKRWEEKNRDGTEEGQLFLQNYVDICIHNWDIVKDVISLDKNDKEAKRKNTEWIQKLNTIRNKVVHPEQGILDVGETAYVKEIHEKVLKHFTPKI